MPDAITISRVTKTFGPKVAVKDLDLVIPEGGLYGLIGPNGAGKTTTIRMVMSILFPDSGELTVLGRRSAVESKDRIGYLPEERGVYRKMKVGAFLAYCARIKGVDATGLTRKIDDWLQRVQLEGVAKKKCEELSKGMQQKVQVVATLLPDPDLLILDEPFSGLDPVNMRLLRDLILEEHGKGKTVIFSTHVMHQAETLCDHIVMINNGRKVLDDTLSGIRNQFTPRHIDFEPLQDDGFSLVSVPGVQEIAAHGSRLRATLADSDVVGELTSTPTVLNTSFIEHGADPEAIDNGASRSCVVEFDAPDAAGLLSILSLPGVESLSPGRGVLQANLAENVDPTGVVQQIAREIPIARIELRRSLEDVFIDIAGATGASEEALRAGLRERSGAVT